MKARWGRGAAAALGAAALLVWGPAIASTEPAVRAGEARSVASGGGALQPTEMAEPPLSADRPEMDEPPLAADRTEPDAQQATELRRAGARAYLLERLAAGASLGYFTAKRARILSEIHFDFPFLVIRQQSLYVRGSLESSTVKTGARIRADSFRAQDMQYLVEAGVRDYLSNRLAIAAFLGQQGRAKLDKVGSRSIRYLGVGFESVGFPRPGGRERFEWRLAAGPAFDKEGVAGDVVVRGSFLYDVWRGVRSSVGIDGSFDALFDGSSGQTEYRVGPRWTFPLTNGIRAALFAEWIRGRNPLDLSGHQGWNLGFRYAEGAYAGPHSQPLPDVRGVLSFGRGSSRGFGRFDLDLSSPAIRIAGSSGRVFANLDANLVGGTGTDNLYYIATAGVEVEALPRVLLGPTIYHRSNHTFGEGPTNATSLNIVQVTVRTAGWDFANRLSGQLMPDPAGRESRWLDRFEGILAPGVVTNSAFSRTQSWDLQAGLRADLAPRSRPIVPFVRVFGEWGDAERREGGLGFSTKQNLVIELRYRRDTQDFGEDQRDVFLSGALFF